MKTFKKYWSIFQITLVNSLAYPGELIGRSLMIVPFMWIFYQLWKVTFQAAGTDNINGMTLYSTMWYLMMAETIELSRPALARTISENVKDGSIAYILNKPYSFLLYQFSNSMGETIFRALTNALLGSAIVWWLVGTVGMAVCVHCAIWDMGLELLHHLPDRAGCIYRRGCFAVSMDLSKVRFYSRRIPDSAQFLSAMAADHCQSPAFCRHDLWTIPIICGAFA